MLGSWSFPLVTNYAPDGIDIRKFLVNIQNRVVYIMIVSKIEPEIGDAKRFAGIRLFIARGRDTPC